MSHLELNKIATTILAPQAIESINCGTVQTMFLPLDYDLSPEVLRQGIKDDEYAQSQEIRNEKRKNEYLRARWLAHYGHGMQHSVLRAPSGEPTFDAIHALSITHCQGHVAVAKVDRQSIRSVGIDLEQVNRVRVELQEKICTQHEQNTLAQMNSAHLSDVLSLIFSAKESLYKAYFPVGRRFFYFHAAEFHEFDWQNGQIHGVFMEDTSPYSPRGSSYTIGFKRLQYKTQAFWLTFCSFTSNASM